MRLPVPACLTYVLHEECARYLGRGPYDYENHEYGDGPNRWALHAFEQCFPLATPLAESSTTKIGVDYILGSCRIQVKSDMRALCSTPGTRRSQPTFPTRNIAIQREKITWANDGSEILGERRGSRDEPSWTQTDLYFHFLGVQSLVYSKTVRDQLIDGKVPRWIRSTSSAYLVGLNQIYLREDVYVCKEV